jgi:hypothetical protein
VRHHYAPLAFVNWAKGKLNFDACNCEFEPISTCFDRSQKVPSFGGENLSGQQPIKESMTEKGDIAVTTAITQAPGQAATPAKKTAKRSRAKKKPR